MAIGDYTIPRPNSPISEGGSNPTREWYNYLRFLGQGGSTASLQAEITTISIKLGSPDGTPDNIPPITGGGNIIGIDSIRTYGALPGTVQLSLSGDVLNPGNTYYYGTGHTGNKGFFTVGSAFLGTPNNITLTTASNGVTTIDLSTVADAGGGELLGFTRDSYGRVSGTHAITVTGTANQINVTDGAGTGAAITLSTPQDIATSSTPTFAQVALAADPTNALEAATKQYVDNVATGLSPKAPALLATTTNDTLTGLAPRDGITPIAGSRVLVKSQTLPAQNGIYIASATAWTRATDMATWTQVPSAYLWIEEGTINADTGWVCTSDPSGVIGVTAITFVQFGGNGTVTAGTGITVTGNQVSLANTAVTPLSYGDSTHVATFTVDAQGRLTTASSVAITFPSSAVTSVFGRTGAVVATSGDYTFAQIGSTPTTLAGYGITNGVANTIQVIAGTGLSGGGALSSNVTLNLASTAVTAGTYGDGTHVAQVTINAQGQITSASNVAITAGGSGTVTSVALTAPTQFSVSGSPVTNSGTLALAWATQSANLVLAGPSSGAAATPTFRSLVAADIPALSYVSSVGLSLPAIFTVAGSPVTSSGTLTGTLATQSANLVFAGPSSGSAAAPTFRAPVLADIGVALPNGYIDGLVLSWNSTTSISVSSGNAFIPNGTFINSSSTLTLSSLSLSASTFYHVYLFNNSGTPAIECVTTAPAAPYSGVSRAKTGDTSRRYLGSVVTDGSSNILKFQHDSEHGLILYISAVTNNLVVTGNATTPTTVSCSSYVPVTGILARMFMLNGAAATGTPVLLYANSNLSGTLSATNYHGFVYPQTCMMADVSLDSSQAFQYAFSVAPSSGNFFGRVAGYIFGR